MWLVICNNTKENLLREPKKKKVKFHKITSYSWNFQNFTFVFTIGQFTVVCLVSQPLSEREAEVDLVLIKNLDPFLM